MDEQQMMDQDHAISMGRTAYMSNNSNELNTLLAKLTDPESDIYEVYLSLKGLKINGKGEEIGGSKALLNDRGVESMIRLMRSVVNQQMFMTDITEEDARILTVGLGDKIIDELAKNRFKYEIENFDDMTSIWMIICMRAFAALNSAKNNGWRRSMRTMVMETNINTSGQGVKPKSGIRSLLSLGQK